MASTALDAYWNFFTTFNSRDAYAFASALSYPHVRITWQRDPSVIADAETHALTHSWNPIVASGWVRTEGMSPRVIHEHSEKAHIAGGWTRYSADDQPILTNRVCYIVTRLDDRWGIQCRFGTDFGSQVMADAAKADSKKLLHRFLTGLQNGTADVLAKVCDDDFYLIGSGEIKRLRPAQMLNLSSFDTLDSTLVQGGDRSATYALSSGSAKALIYLKFNGKWTVKAGSWL